MHAPFAPFSNASFRRYSVMQELHLTTMPMAQPVPRRKRFYIIGGTALKGKEPAMGAQSGKGFPLPQTLSRMGIAGPQ